MRKLKRRVYVKPVTDKTEMFGWLTLEFNIFEALVDDLRRYGKWTAARNFFKTLLQPDEYFEEVKNDDAGREGVLPGEAKD